MFFRPPSAAAYWRNEFPYSVVQQMFACMPWPGTEVGRRFRVEGSDELPWARSADYTSLDGGLGSLRPVLDYWATKTTSVHIAPHPQHYLVFDIDLRDQPGACPEERHPRSVVCPNCWPATLRAYDLVEQITCGEFGFPTKPLPVYSGGNGVHYWCRVPPRWTDDMGDMDARRTVLMPVVIGERAERAGIKFDDKVTRGRQHMIRMPFSLHDSTRRVALPLDLATLRAGVSSDTAGSVEAGKATLEQWLKLAAA